MSVPLASIVIPTRNGGDTLAAVLDAIARQRTDFEYEIVAVDSGSEDGSLPLLQRSAARVITIPPGSFNHGRTRNVAVEHARGELIVFLVQDAIPATDDWLIRLTAPLRGDPVVAGAFGRQQPTPHATAISRRYLSEWVAASPTPRSVRLGSARELEGLDPLERLQLCAFDNVCSCIRRTVWRHIPFPETPIAEDLEWGRLALVAGHRLDYVADAIVLHSHDRSAWYEFSRTYVLHRRLLEVFGLRTIPNLRVLARAIGSSARLHLECERRAAREGAGTAGIARALALAVAWPLGQYVGALSAARGWKPMRVAAV